jgi:predicted RNA-binding Zn-ribbon protein involved in translation (DUF1610 family)
VAGKPDRAVTVVARKKRKRSKQEVPDLGSATFECPQCGHPFEVPWLQIFDLQEMTHGFVGFELQNDYIACPKCGANANRESLCPYGEALEDDEDDEDLPF